MRLQLFIFVGVVQTIILLGHLFVYRTWADFCGEPSAGVKICIALLSFSFIGASFLARYSHALWSRVVYTFSAVWLGIGSFCLWAAALCWIARGAATIFGIHLMLSHVARALFGAALLASVWGMINAGLLRVSSVTVSLATLPESWRGRRAVLISDLHLGHVRNLGFLTRVIDRVRRLQPNIVFVAGDLYDGTAVDFELLSRPWREYIASASCDPSFSGVYYITGNHEEFFGEAKFLHPLQHAGVQLLDNNKVELDGLQLAGVHYRDAASVERYHSVMRTMNLDRHRASVLLLHAPVRLQVAQAEGVSLQLSGHTHGAQFFPWTLFGKRVWGRLNHGLSRIGGLQVYVGYGAGTWGPPMRLGTIAEITCIRFEKAS